MNNVGNSRDVALLALAGCKLCWDKEEPGWYNWSTTGGVESGAAWHRGSCKAAAW